jgi:hypothetical protein
MRKLRTGKGKTTTGHAELAAKNTRPVLGGKLPKLQGRASAVNAIRANSK